MWQLHILLQNFRWFHSRHQSGRAGGRRPISVSGRSLGGNRTHPIPIRDPDCSCAPFTPEASTRGWYLPHGGRTSSRAEVWVQRRKTRCRGKNIQSLWKRMGSQIMTSHFICFIILIHCVQHCNCNRFVNTLWHTSNTKSSHLKHHNLKQVTNNRSQATIGMWQFVYLRHTIFGHFSSLIDLLSYFILINNKNKIWFSKLTEGQKWFSSQIFSLVRNII